MHLVDANYLLNQNMNSSMTFCCTSSSSYWSRNISLRLLWWKFGSSSVNYLLNTQ